MSLLISLRSETLKLKRTLLIYLCVSAAAFTALMSFLEYLDLGPTPKTGLPWTVHFMKGREPLGSSASSVVRDIDLYITTSNRIQG